MKHKYYETTNYPKIYKNTYWGAFTDDKNKFSNFIIYNRNRFIEDFNVQSYKRLVHLENIIKYYEKKFGNLIIDHVEYYKTKKYVNGKFDCVLIISPYNVSADQEKKLLDDGWNKIYHMYSLITKSYYKIPVESEIKSFVKK
jgi:hypothetical protein